MTISDTNAKSLPEETKAYFAEQGLSTGIPKKLEVGNAFLDMYGNTFRITKIWLEVGHRSMGTPWVEYNLTFSGKTISEKNSYENFVRNYFR